MPRFHIEGLACGDEPPFLPPLEGYDTGQLWNGWRCPLFPKASADALVQRWVEIHGTFTGVNDAQTGPEERPTAWFDERTRCYWFYHPASDELETYDPSKAPDGTEVWAIGAWGWTWELEPESDGAS